VAEAFILINCDMGKEKDVVEDLLAIKDIKEAQATVGIYDVVAKLESESEKDLKNTVDLEIRKIQPINYVLMLQSA